MKKNFWIFQSGETLQVDKDSMTPMRAIQLSEFLQKKGFNVTLISSNFNHFFKKFRYKKKENFFEIKIKKKIKLILINSPGYKNNISIQRLIDHFILAKNLKCFLKAKKNLPDYAFIGFPPIETTICFANWLHKNKIPFAIDVKDLWPEYFYENKKIKLFSFFIKLLFSIHDFLLVRSMRKAQIICSNNDFFIDFICKKLKRKRNNLDSVMYLTKSKINKLNANYSFLNKINFSKKFINFYFCGNINFNIFDFFTVLKSIKYFNDNEYKIRFYIAGYGNKEEIQKLKKLILDYNLGNCYFIGYVKFVNNIFLLKNCDFFIAPYFDTMTFTNSYPNKLIECFQYGIPVITSLTGDSGKFIKKKSLGLLYEANNHLNLTSEIKKILDNKILYKRIKKNSITNSMSDKFNHENNYSKFLKNIKI